MWCCFGAKGGVGCSVVAAALALLRSRTGPTLLVDRPGGQPDLLGISVPERGVDDWLDTPFPLPDTLSRLEVPVTEQLALLPRGAVLPHGRERGHQAIPDPSGILSAVLSHEGRPVIVDLGTGTDALELLDAAERTLLVTRSCYLALAAARRGPIPDDVIVIHEPGRAFRRSDVQDALGAPVSVWLDWHPAVGRTVDAGLLTSRMPSALKPLGRLL